MASKARKSGRFVRLVRLAAAQLWIRCRLFQTQTAVYKPRHQRSFWNVISKHQLTHPHAPLPFDCYAATGNFQLSRLFYRHVLFSKLCDTTWQGTCTSGRKYCTQKSSQLTTLPYQMMLLPKAAAFPQPFRSQRASHVVALTIKWG